MNENKIQHNGHHTNLQIVLDTWSSNKSKDRMVMTRINNESSRNKGERGVTSPRSAVLFAAREGSGPRAEKLRRAVLS